MSEETNKKLFDHYNKLIGGSVKTGNPTRDDLIVSDAQRHLADLVKKNSSLQVKPAEPVLAELPIEEKKPTKSKEKK